jgi:hypothetical protein
MKYLQNSLLIGLLVAFAAACSDGNNGEIPDRDHVDAGHDQPDADIPVPAVTVIVQTADIGGHPQSGNTDVIAANGATLTRTEGGASIHFSTSGLVDGDVYTLWWVILNKPEMCTDDPCGFDDTFVNQLVTGADVVQAGYGKVVDATEDQIFSAYLPKGDLAKGWFDEGFTNPMGAEIFMILNSHGPAIDGEVGDMTSSYRGGCTDASIPPPFPAKGKLDGKVGPNTCVLSQEAPFLRP